MYKFFYFLQTDTTSSAIAANSATIYTISYILIGLAVLILLITIIYYFKSKIKARSLLSSTEKNETIIEEPIYKEHPITQIKKPQISDLRNELNAPKEQEGKTGKPFKIEEIVKPTQSSKKTEQKEKIKPEVKKKALSEDKNQ